MALVNRNPFARQETHKRSVKTKESCAFCGCKKQNSRLYQYSVEHDGIRNQTTTIDGLFCSIGCMRAYHHIWS